MERAKSAKLSKLLEVTHVELGDCDRSTTSSYISQSQKKSQQYTSEFELTLRSIGLAEDESILEAISTTKSATSSSLAIKSSRSFGLFSIIAVIKLKKSDTGALEEEDPW